MHKRIATAVAGGALVLGAAGATFLIPSLVAAADPSASPAATPAATTSTGSSSSGSSSTQASPGTTTTTTGGNCSGGGMAGGPGMGADDITAAAKAIGVTEAELTTALQGGQTIADVAAANNVTVQTVIDAMVAAEKAEIQALVDAGTITQAQADQQIANLTAHETDEVNGTFTPGMGGGPGRHGQPPSGTSNGSTTTTPTTTGTSS